MATYLGSNSLRTMLALYRFLMHVSKSWVRLAFYCNPCVLRMLGQERLDPRCVKKNSTEHQTGLMSGNMTGTCDDKAYDYSRVLQQGRT